jgi:plastocyanin
MLKKMAIVAAALLVGLMAAACGSKSNTSAGAGGRATPTVSATTDAPSPQPSETSGETRVAFEDNHFQPASLTVASGAELELDNEGNNTHTFTIDGQGIDVQVDSGKDAKVTAPLDPGTYEFFCRFHKSMGMKGTLTVTG